MDEKFISGVIVRSKELWVEQGEKPTKVLFQFGENEAMKEGND